MAGGSSCPLREQGWKFVSSRERTRMGASRSNIFFSSPALPKTKSTPFLPGLPMLKAPSSTFEGLAILENGLIGCAGRMPEQCGDADKKDDPVEFAFYPLPGQVFRATLISQDQKTELFFAIQLRRTTMFL